MGKKKSKAALAAAAAASEDALLDAAVAEVETTRKQLAEARPRPAADAQASRKRPKPAHASTALSGAQKRFAVGSRYVNALLYDDAALVGCVVLLPNSAWGQQYDDGGATPTTVKGFLAGGSGDGSDAYVGCAEGHNYIFTARAVLAADRA